DMLAGESGPIARDVEELADHIADRLKPDVVIFSNALLVGALRRLKERYSGPVYCTLQGDDVFTEALPDSHKQRVLDVLSERAQQFDGFLTHTRFYRDHMAAYLRLPIDRFHIIPLGIDFTGHDGPVKTAPPAFPSPAGGDGRDETGVVRPFAIGFFARIAPEKGLHHLVDAALLLHARRPGTFVVKAGGYLNPQHRPYFADVQKKARPLGDAFQYTGSPETHEQKVEFYKSLDVLSVPTEFLEPKGLYILEALANGVPVVQPAHGAFPELIDATGGGLLVEPKSPPALADALERLLDDGHMRRQLGAAGHAGVRNHFTLDHMVRSTFDTIR
ncbi:MAG: glycosyltransferase family 4 protein, partial [Planctomycetaceae bacterium]|nr:glycosyltransferase family 4 protein [Planctomycetaceae bacterium]